MSEKNTTTLTAPYTAQEWTATPRVTDPDYAGSVFEQMNLSAELCPACGAHLSLPTPDELKTIGHVTLPDIICLNGCHLGSVAKQRLQNMFKNITGSDFLTDLLTLADKADAERKAEGE